ncbi:MAG: anhydro-N-acetylmuramic acid kinase [Alphaproteobacteria bacterium]|jgi:anhydro-N-acetylmuramic acid kinase|nr:anhydro-N-acetylmuramic acid kinase [Alphaproteobacteria bacterium]
MGSADQKVAIGLMSGTSMDGIDAALIETDGGASFTAIAATSIPYQSAFRDSLRAALGHAGPFPALAAELTDLHVDAVAGLLASAGMSAANVDVVGFHGHTIFHDPGNRSTVQIGDGDRLARDLGIDVVHDFRSADVAAGGQGAPFAPLFHAVLAPEERPLCFLNIGGVANLTWVAPGANPAQDDVFDQLLAFDTGPGNALIDDWVQRHAGMLFDDDGALAASGTVDADVLEALLANAYFEALPPKSLDRTDFSIDRAAQLSAADGAATLSMFTVEAIRRSAGVLPTPPVQWLVTGGGRKNSFLLRELESALNVPVRPTEAVGIDGDALEAQAFGYLAVRHLAGLPLSGPTTTGVPSPQTGGRRSNARSV